MTILQKKQLIKNLQAVKKVIETRGWCKGENENREKHVCLQGAINVAIIGKPYAYRNRHKVMPTRNVIEQTIIKKYGIFDMTDFNDRAQTRKKTVLNVIDQTVKRVKESA